MTYEVTKIFLASNFKDFKDLRNLISQEMNLLRQTARSIELIDLDDDNADVQAPIDRSLKSVRETDIFIVLVGDNYGGIPDGYTKSYTHLEYEEAVNNHKEILAYCIGNSYNDKENIIYSREENFAAWQKAILKKSTVFTDNANCDIKVLAEKIRNKVAKLIEEKNFKTDNKVIYNHTVSNTISKLDNKSHIPRSKEIDIVKTFLDQNQNKSSILHVSGNAGMGKSSFLIDFYHSIKNDMNSFVYFNSNDSEDEVHLDSIYKHLLKYFQYITKENLNVYNKYNSIDESLNIADKINKLFSIYAEYYTISNIPFIFIIDSTDILKNEKEVIKKIIHPNRGVHFLFSGRVNSAQEYLKQQELQFDFFHLYRNSEKNESLVLENLNNEIMLRIIEHSLIRYNFLTSNEKKIISNLIMKKSGGLPLYLRYQIENLNIKILEDEHVFQYMKSYLEDLPDKINDFYQEIFKNLDSLSMDILQMLYWNNTPLDKRIILTILNIDDVQYNKAVKDIAYLLFNDKYFDSIAIDHLSVKEALYTFYMYNEQHQQTAQKLNREFLSNALNKEHKIFERITRLNDILDDFTNLTYYSSENKLFQKLENIIKYYLSNNVECKNTLYLFYEYFKIVHLADNINPTLIYKNFKFSEIFVDFKCSDYLKQISYKFLSDVITKKPVLNIFEINKLLQISVTTDNSYFSAKYSKQLSEYHYKFLLETAYDSENLSKQIYASLSSVFMQSYVTCIRELEGKQCNSSLTLYNDENILLYVPSGNIKTEDLLINFLKSKFHLKVSIVDMFFKQYQTIKHSGTIELLVAFEASILKQKYYLQKTETNSQKIEKLQHVLYDVQYEILVRRIKDFNKEEKRYMYLSRSLQAKLNKVKKLYTTYSSDGLLSILQQENNDLSIEIGKFINVNDVQGYFNYYLNQQSANIDINIVLRNLLITVSDKENLTYFKEYIHSQKYQTNKLLLMSLLNIYYKLKDLDAIKKLKKHIIYIEAMQKERTFLSTILQNISDDFLKSYKLFPNINVLKYKFNHEDSVKSYEIDELLSVEAYRTDNSKTIENCIDGYLKLTPENIGVKKEVFKKYKNHLNQKLANNCVLNILLEENLESFFSVLQEKMLADEIIAYFNDNINILLKKDVLATKDDNFWNFILDLYRKNDITESMVVLLQKVYTSSQFVDYCQNNREKIFEMYTLFCDPQSDEKRKIKHYFYAGYLITLDEKHYIDIFNSEWIDTAIIDSPFIMMFIFNSKSEKTVSDFLDKIPDVKRTLKLGS